MRSVRWPVHVDTTSVASPPMRAFLGLAVTLLVVPLVFAPTAATMVRTWIDTVTFNHCFLVAPLVLWLVWRKRFELAATPARASWVALVSLALAGAAWILASFASSAAAAQWAMTAMIPLAFTAVFGIARARVLLFPLAFLFFAVPFGEVFVPALIDRTADFTTFALRLIGVPVLREGADLTIPSGRWSVVDACSGVRFLIASVVAGSLYAYEMYRSPVRRAAFVVASIVVPIVANWLRAFLIVLIAHLSSNRIAAGVDHLVYGWFFFAFVLLLLFWIGSFWREPAADDAAPAVALAGSTSQMSVVALVAAAAMLVVWPIAYAVASTTPARAVPPVPEVEARGGWQRLDADVASWRPVLENPDRLSLVTFGKGDRRVTVAMGQFRGQTQGHSAVSSQNRFVADRDPEWRPLLRGSAVAQLGGAAVEVREVLLGGGTTPLLVWQWNWSPSLITGSDVSAKLALAIDRIRGRHDDAAWVAVFTPAGEANAAADTLAAFARDMGPSLDAALRKAASQP